VFDSLISAACMKPQLDSVFSSAFLVLKKFVFFFF
jgi:hypothetical protein